MYNTERICITQNRYVYIVSRNDKFNIILNINTERICIVLYINIRICPERRDDRGTVINLILLEY